MNIKLTDAYLGSVVNAMANASTEDIQSYFQSLKLLPDGEAITEAIQAKMLEDFYVSFFPSQRGVPLIDTEAARLESEERMKEFAEQKQTEHEVETFSFFSAEPDQFVYYDDEDECCCDCDDECELDEEEETDHDDILSSVMNSLERIQQNAAMQLEEDAAYSPDSSMTASLSMNLDGGRFTLDGNGVVFTSEDVHELSAIIKSQKQHKELTDLISQAATSMATTAAADLTATIQSQLNVKSLSELIAEQAAEQAVEEVASEEDENVVRLSNLIDETLAALHGHASAKNAVSTFEEIIEGILDGIVDELITSDLIDAEFSIGEESIRLYEYYIASLFHNEAFSQGIFEQATYRPEYTAYVMTELAHHFAENKGYGLAFQIDENGVFPILRAQN